jgi:MurNAc alpha-1-phosphate uridylyltransferase
MSPSLTGRVAAMVLAAGRGERMRPLTDSTPKPLLAVHGKPLMQWHLEALARAGCTRVVANTAWLGDHIEAAFGDTFDYHGAHVQMTYSHEGKDFGGALETAGGIARALPMLCDGAHNDPGIFWLVAGDVYVPEFAFDSQAVQRFADSGRLAHLWLVPNPKHNPLGDFGLQALPGAGEPSHLALNLNQDTSLPRYTYSTIGLFSKALFLQPWCDIPLGNPLGAKAALAPLLRRAMDQGQVSAQLYTGRWTDVGTPERLRQLQS